MFNFKEVRDVVTDMFGAGYNKKDKPQDQDEVADEAQSTTENNPHLALLRKLLKEDPYYTLQELGDYCGVTRERVRQILHANNITKAQGKRSRLKNHIYVAVHTKNSAVTNIDIGEDSHISKEEVLEFLDPEHTKFLGIPLDRIQTSTMYIRMPLRPWNQTSKGLQKYCGTGHYLLCFGNPQNASSWRCYVCKPVYQWEYINPEGRIEKQSKTQPCNMCGKPVTKRAAILWRHEQDERYHGNFYCDRKCFKEQHLQSDWWKSSPIYQGTYWKNVTPVVRTCVVCNISFKTEYKNRTVCGEKCNYKRSHQARMLRKSKVGVENNAVNNLMKLGLSAQDIADYLQCSTQTVYGWRRGFPPSEKNSDQLKRLTRITKTLGA